MTLLTCSNRPLRRFRHCRPVCFVLEHIDDYISVDVDIAVVAVLVVVLDLEWAAPLLLLTSWSC